MVDVSKVDSALASSTAGPLPPAISAPNCCASAAASGRWAAAGSFSVIASTAR